MRFEVIDVEHRRYAPFPCYATGGRGRMCQHAARFVRMRHCPVPVGATEGAHWAPYDGYCAGHAPAYVGVRSALRCAWRETDARRAQKG